NIHEDGRVPSSWPRFASENATPWRIGNDQRQLLCPPLGGENLTHSLLLLLLLLLLLVRRPQDLTAAVSPHGAAVALPDRHSCARRPKGPAGRPADDDAAGPPP